MLSVLRFLSSQKTLLTVALIVAAALLLALIGFHIPMRLDGDQSLYMFGARQMSEGVVLYRDFWDIKAPGVYVFYWLAGTLFGFTPFGLHLLEAIWLAIAGVLTYRLCAIATNGSRLALLGPFFSLGAFFAAATPWHLTQPDGLATVPLTFAAWAIVEPRFRQGRPVVGWILAGVGAGLSAMFVTASAIVVLSFVLTAAIIAWRLPATGVQISATKKFGGFLLGLVAFLLIPIIWFASLGALQEYLWTVATYPVAAQSEFVRDVSKLARSVRWFIESVLVLIPAALLGVFAAVRGTLARDSRAHVGLLMSAWFVGGFVALLVQYHYSWQFHFNHFFVPVGVLTAMGLAEAVRVVRTQDGRLVAGAFLVVAVCFPLLLVKKVISGSEAYQSAHDFEDSVKQGLATAVASDSVYVLGDPRVLMAAGYSQPVRENGWALEVLLQKQWKGFSESLRQSSPVYIYMARSYPALLARNAPELKEWIEQEYTGIHTDDAAGTWYRRNDVSFPTHNP